LYYFGRMKATITIVLLALYAVFAPAVAHSQDQNEKLSYLDETGNPIKEKKAVFLQQVIQFDDTLWELNFYRMHGPRIKSFRCRDEQGKILNGRFVSYSASGSADTIGEYTNGKQTGFWNIYTMTGRLIAQQKYENGDLLWTKDTLQLNRHVDSLMKSRKDSVNIQRFTKIEIESEFPGGTVAWLKYLNKNLRYPDDAVNRRIQGQVVVGFIVDTLGHIPVSSAWVNRSVEFSLDKEALRIILNSPAWTPASQNGRLVKSYKMQPIIFKFQ
jgi:TonB family protein